MVTSLLLLEISMLLPVQIVSSRSHSSCLIFKGLFARFTGYIPYFILANFGRSPICTHGAHRWASGHIMCHIGRVSVSALSKVLTILPYFSHSIFDFASSQISFCFIKQCLWSECWNSTTRSAKIGRIQSRWDIKIHSFETIAVAIYIKNKPQMFMS